MIFGTVKEGIMEGLEDHLGSFRYEIVAMMGVCTLTFHEFRTSGALKFFGKKEPITSRRWLADVAYAFHISSYPDGAKVRLASYLLKNRAQDYWEEVGHALGGELIESMSWEDFVMIFQAEFSPVIEVQQLAREFRDHR